MPTRPNLSQTIAGVGFYQPPAPNPQPLFYHRLFVRELRAVDVFGGLRAVDVGAPPLAAEAGGARGACALARPLGAAAGGGAALLCAPARPVAHALEGVEVALGQDFARRLAQPRGDDGEGQEAGVEDDADHKHHLAGDDADGRAVYEGVEVVGRDGVDVDLQVPAGGEQDENPEVVAPQASAQGLP